MRPNTFMITALLFTAIAALATLAQVNASSSPPACATPDYRQFDFWLGDWTVVETATHKLAGRNIVMGTQGGCVLQEHWVGVDGTTGTSFNLYYAPDRKWHQAWVDNQGLLLQLEGELRDGKMTLNGWRRTRSGKRVIDRIQWTAEPNGNVRQVWDTSSDGHNWRTIFDGTYIKR